MNKHTPGPWEVYYEVFRPQLSPMKIIEIHDQNQKPIIAWLGFDGLNRPKKETLANAHLIAAVPELLETCKTLLKRMDDLITTHQLETDADVVMLRHARREWNQAQQIIQKAEGKP